MKNFFKKIWDKIDGNKTTLGLALWIVAPACGALTLFVQAGAILLGGTGVAHKFVKKIIS